MTQSRWAPLKESLVKFSLSSDYLSRLIMLYILYIALTLVGDEHLFQIRANVLFFLLYRLEIKFSYSNSYSYDITLCRRDEIIKLIPKSSEWLLSVSHPDDLTIVSISSEWFISWRYLIRMTYLLAVSHPDDLTIGSISSGWLNYWQYLIRMT